MHGLEKRLVVLVESADLQVAWAFGALNTAACARCSLTKLGSYPLEEVLLPGKPVNHGLPLGVSQHALPHQRGDEFAENLG
jgi:hypothetical protein